MPGVLGVKQRRVQKDPKKNAAEITSWNHLIFTSKSLWEKGWQMSARLIGPTGCRLGILTLSCREIQCEYLLVFPVFRLKDWILAITSIFCEL